MGTRKLSGKPDEMLGDYLQWISIPSRKSSNTPSHFMLQKPSHDLVYSTLRTYLSDLVIILMTGSIEFCLYNSSLGIGYLSDDRTYIDLHLHEGGEGSCKGIYMYMDSI